MRGGLSLAWLIDTSSILGGADTYLLTTRVTGWDLDAYEAWLVTTWTRLAAAAGRHAPPRAARRDVPPQAR